MDKRNEEAVNETASGSGAEPQEPSANAEPLTQESAGPDSFVEATREIAHKAAELRSTRAAELSRTAFRLVLGSHSPRRRQLLADSGYRFATLPSDDGVEEKAERSELEDAEPRKLTLFLAFYKAQNVAGRLLNNPEERERIAQEFNAGETSPFVVLGCDSVAVCKGEVMGKPKDRSDAERMLRKLSGSLHAVHTGVCLWRVDPLGNVLERVLQRVETSVLKMDPLSESQLMEYLDSGKWSGKAGAFGYQDGNDWLKLNLGTESNVVGLPLEALAEMVPDMVD